MAEKVTIMVLEVIDLKCLCCYKKVKKLLCKFPQIRDQFYDEKQNKVTITVVCCSPEKIRDKLCCKGGKTIKSIEIKPPPKPNELEKPKEPEKLKEPEKPKELEKPKEPEKSKEPEKPKEVEKTKQPPPKGPSQPPLQPVQAMPIIPAHRYPSIFTLEVCCGPCYEGRAGGPCYHGYGRPEPCYNNYGYNNGTNYGYGAYGGGRPCYISRCDTYFSDENASACTIM